MPTEIFARRPARLIDGYASYNLAVIFIFGYIECEPATLAQLVEQRFCKAKVPGPNPGGGSWI